MAEKQDTGLIGFDPLAWMSDEDVDAKKEVETETMGENKKQPERVETSEELLGKEVEAEAKKEVEIETKTLVDPVDPLVQGAGAETEKETDDLKITLDSTLNIQNVSELYEQLSKRLDHQDTIEIDASAVVSIDTATLQLLIVLKQEAVKLHKEVVIDFPSDKFIESAELLGLSEMLGVDQAASGFF